jgi:hypothetical protein
MFDRKTEYRVLVCGGRDYGVAWNAHLNKVVVDTQAVHKLHSVLGDIKVPENCVLVIVHGAARGADSLAADWAKSKNIRDMPFPADWSGRSGGIDRNIQMLEEAEPDLVIAFPGGRGTAHMVGLARSTRTPLVVVE